MVRDRQPATRQSIIRTEADQSTVLASTDWVGDEAGGRNPKSSMEKSRGNQRPSTRPYAEHGGMFARKAEPRLFVAAKVEWPERSVVTGWPNPSTETLQTNYSR